MEDNMKIELPINMWNVILNALGHRPYVEVKELIEEITKQAKDQLGQNSELNVKDSK